MLKIAPPASPVTIPLVGKFKVAKAKKSRPSLASNKSAIPCLFLIVMGIVLLSLLFYFVLKSST